MVFDRPHVLTPGVALEATKCATKIKSNVFGTAREKICRSTDPPTLGVPPKFSEGH